MPIALSQRRTAYVSEGRLRTLGSPFFALQLQGQDGGVAGSSGSQILDLLTHTSYVSRVVLLILALFSIASWTVILYKLWSFKRAERQTKELMKDAQTLCSHSVRPLRYPQSQVPANAE